MCISRKYTWSLEFKKQCQLFLVKKFFEDSNAEAVTRDMVAFDCFNPTSKRNLLYSDMQKLTERNLFLFFLIFIIMI